jgi:hypothetical protein
MRGVDISWKQARGEKINHLLWVPLTAFSCLLAAHVQSNMSGSVQDRERDGLDEAVDIVWMRLPWLAAGVLAGGRYGTSFTFAKFE